MGNLLLLEIVFRKNDEALARERIYRAFVIVDA
jgi:hypothetical protein